MCLCVPIGGGAWVGVGGGGNGGWTCGAKAEKKGVGGEEWGQEQELPKVRAS